jgi:F-type H+-transporting ATPase subunit delta
MNDGLISNRYAKALLEFATERGEEAALYASMKRLSASLAALPLLRKTLQSPVVSGADKLKLLCIAAGEGTPDGSYRRFAQLLLENHREAQSQSVALCYVAQYREAHRIATVQVVTNDEPSPAFVERVRKAVERRIRGTVEVESRADSSLGGGFIFQINDLRLDASVAGQVEKLRKKIAGA